MFCIFNAILDSPRESRTVVCLISLGVTATGCGSWKCQTAGLSYEESPSRKVHFCGRLFVLAHMILEDIYKIITHSPLKTFQKFSYWTNYLHDFMGSGGLFYLFWTMTKSHIETQTRKNEGFWLLKKYCERSSRIVTEIRRNEHSVTMRASVFGEATWVSKWHFLPSFLADILVITECIVHNVNSKSQKGRSTVETFFIMVWGWKDHYVILQIVFFKEMPSTLPISIITRF